MHLRLPARSDAADDALDLPPVTWDGVALGIAVLVSGYLLSRLAGWLGGLAEAGVKTGADLLVVEGGPGLLAAVTLSQEPA